MYIIPQIALGQGQQLGEPAACNVQHRRLPTQRPNVISADSSAPPNLNVGERWRLCGRTAVYWG
jgi:hypothetical protein